MCIYIFRDSCLDPPPPKSLDFVCLMRVLLFCCFLCSCFFQCFFGFWGFVLLQRVWKQFVGPPVKEYASNF